MKRISHLHLPSFTFHTPKHAFQKHHFSNSMHAHTYLASLISRGTITLPPQKVSSTLISCTLKELVAFTLLAPLLILIIAQNHVIVIQPFVQDV